VSEPGYPVDTVREALPLLRRPFTPEAVKFKVQSAWPSGALVVAYIDARLVAARLNLICPDMWFDSYEHDGDLLLCRLTIGNLTRQDVGEGKGKALYSDAFKRASVKFGVAHCLYAFPNPPVLNAEGLHRQRRGGRELVSLTAAGEQLVRGRYATWLEKQGQQFGPPLSHGDVHGAVGDVEGSPEAPAVAEYPDVAELSISRERAVELAKAVYMIGLEGQLQMWLGSVLGEEEPPPINTKKDALAAVERLTVGQADELAAWVSKHADEQGEG